MIRESLADLKWVLKTHSTLFQTLEKLVITLMRRSKMGNV